MLQYIHLVVSDEWAASSCFNCTTTESDYRMDDLLPFVQGKSSLIILHKLRKNSYDCPLLHLLLINSHSCERIIYC